MNAIKRLIESDRENTEGESKEYAELIEDADAELARLQRIEQAAKEVNNLLNSTMSWMQEEGIEIPFVMSLMVGSLGEKSEQLAAALKAGQK